MVVACLFNGWRPQVMPLRTLLAPVGVFKERIAEALEALASEAWPVAPTPAAHHPHQPPPLPTQVCGTALKGGCLLCGSWTAEDRTAPAAAASTGAVDL